MRLVERIKLPPSRLKRPIADVQRRIVERMLERLVRLRPAPLSDSVLDVALECLREPLILLRVLRLQKAGSCRAVVVRENLNVALGGGRKATDVARQEMAGNVNHLL